MDTVNAFPGVLKVIGADPATISESGRNEILSSMQPGRLPAAQVRVEVNDSRIGGHSPSQSQMAPVTPHGSNVFPSQNAISHVPAPPPTDDPSQVKHVRLFGGDIEFSKTILGRPGEVSFDQGGSKTVNVIQDPDVLKALVPTSYADTLLLPGGVSLQFYGGYAQNGRLLDHRVRYLRHNPDGTVEADVMLVPVEAPLR